MSLADRLDDPVTTAHPNAGCSVGRLYNGMDDPERAAFDKLRARLSDRALADVVADEGYRSDDGTPIADQTFSRHRRRLCRCAALGWTS